MYKSSVPAPIFVEYDPFVKRSDKEGPQPRKRVVQTALGQAVQHSVKDAFLGRENQVVDRETVSQHRRIHMGAHLTAAIPGESSTPSLPQLKDLGLRLVHPQGEVAQSSPHRWAKGRDSPDDFINGMKESDRTALNTKEFVFYGYFQRIREKLDRAWVPILRSSLAKIDRAGRHIASDMEHVTKVLVFLNSSGDITRVKLVVASGLIELDQSAVSAFQTAGPFPNPPKDLIQDGNDVIIPWEFILKT